MLHKKRAEELVFPKPPLRLFNTETRKKEIFHPLEKNHVRIYTCGPTVYHFAHIGNFRTYIFEDILRRTFKFFDYQVTQVMNITDVEDKTIKGAIQSNQSLSDFTQPYKNAFFVDIQSLGIERVEYYPTAVEYIPYMIDMVQKLIDKGIAYKSKDNSIYYSIDKSPRYGRLSHLKLDELKVGARVAKIATDEYEKENVGDFALWKAYDFERDGSIFWESPFGPGRPGWHLECSTMAMQLLGSTIDIHAGAVDNIFPHHENEIAQSESFSEKPFVRYWLHAEHLIVNHKKMSKSLGNFYTLRDLLKKGYNGMEVRYMLMHTHYRTQLNFTFEGMEAAKASLHRLNDFIQRMQEIAEPDQSLSKECLPILQKAIQHFCESMADNLNVSASLAAIFDMMHEINSLYDNKVLSPGDAAKVLYVMQAFNRVLNVFSFKHEEVYPSDLKELLQKREQARKEKNWTVADALRRQIEEEGYLIEDTPHEARLKKK